MPITPRRFAAVTALLLAAPAFAQVHAGDIILSTQGGVIATTRGASGGGFVPNRVVVATLGVAATDFTSNPGFDCLPGTFPTPSKVGFRVLDALRAWDGADFDAVSPERLEVAFSVLAVLTPSSPGVVPGFELNVGSNGTWHRHLEFTLLDPAAPGIYLLELELYSTRAEIAPSLPFWILFNKDQPAAAVDEAAAWVEAFKVNPGPTCGSVDFDGDGDEGTDADIEAFFTVIGGGPCPTGTCGSIDFDGDGDEGTDADIEAFFRVVGGGAC